MPETKRSPSSHLPGSLSLRDSKANQFRTKALGTARAAHVFGRGLAVVLGMALVLLGGLKLASAAKPVAVGSFEGSFAEDVRQNAVEAINKSGELRVVKDKAADRVGINEPKGTYEDNAHTLGVAGILVGVVSDNNDE